MKTGLETWQEPRDDVLPSSFAYGLLGSAAVGLAFWLTAFLLLF